MILSLSSGKVIGVERNKGEFRKEEKCDWSWSVAQLLGGGWEREQTDIADIALSRKKKNQHVSRSCSSLLPIAFFPDRNPEPQGQVSGRGLMPEMWRNKVISSPSATPSQRTSSLSPLSCRGVYSPDESPARWFYFKHFSD